LRKPSKLSPHSGARILPRPFKCLCRNLRILAETHFGPVETYFGPTLSPLPCRDTRWSCRGPPTSSRDAIWSAESLQSLMETHSDYGMPKPSNPLPIQNLALPRASNPLPRRTLTTETLQSLPRRNLATETLQSLPGRTLITPRPSNPCRETLWPCRDPAILAETHFYHTGAPVIPLATARRSNPRRDALWPYRDPPILAERHFGHSETL